LILCTCGPTKVVPCYKADFEHALPTTTSSATARIAATKTAEATAASGVASSSETTAAPTKAAAKTASKATKEAKAEQEADEVEATKEQENDDEENDFAERRAMTNRLRRSYGLSIRERDFGVGGDDLRHLAHGLSNGAVKIIGAQGRNHFAANVAHFSVGQDAFKAISNNDLALVVVNRQKKKQAAIRSLLANFHFGIEAGGVIGGFVAIQGANGDDSDLGVGLGVVELGAERIEASDGLGREHVGVVADVIGGLGQVFNPLGPEGWGKRSEKSCQQQPKNGEMCAAEALHRFLLYVERGRKVP